MKPRPEKKRVSPRSVIIAAVAAAAAMIALTAGFRVLRQVIMRGADSFFYPYLRAAAGSEKISDRSLLLRSPAELAARVEQLGAANRELALQSSAAGTLLEENRILRQMLELSDRGERKFTVAEIMLRDPLRFRESFTIGKGSRHGVAVGAAVVEVSPDGRLLLIGVIAECGARTAKVVTIADNSLHISGRVGANGAVGFTNTGTGNAMPGRVRFGMLPVRDDYISGGAVVTTGFERNIPAGIKIGELDFSGAVLPSLNTPDYSCDLIPAVKLESLRFVAVLTTPAPGPDIR